MSDIEQMAAYLLRAYPERVRQFAQDTETKPDYSNDPYQYARNVLEVDWWQKQREIAEGLLKPPYKVLAKACTNVGKTFVAGSLVNWWYDTFNPSLVLTTAPTDKQVKDLLWKEVRVQRRGRGGWRGQQMARLEDAANHFAHGFTARDAESFQGHHGPRILFIFDEAIGLKPFYNETAKTMFDPSQGHAWLCLFNPTNSGTWIYEEELSGNWTTIQMSALDHPNVRAGLEGGPIPYPGAITLPQVTANLEDWCTPIAEEEAEETDLEWPPGSGRWLRPGPLAESRVLGRWPSAGTYGVWSDAVWMKTQKKQEPDRHALIEIGCDPARQGDDFTAIHVRKGNVSLYHQRANGWTTDSTAGRLKVLCAEYAQHNQRPQQIPVKIDPDGLGWGVVDQKGDFNFIPVSGSAASSNRRDYPNRRSELWFQASRLARRGGIDLTRIPKDMIKHIRQQAMEPIWKQNAEGQCQVEKKDEMKRRLNHSPDDMDAVNLCYWPMPSGDITAGLRQLRRQDDTSGAQRRGLMGIGGGDPRDRDPERKGWERHDIG